jgi:hypothetical protein
LVTTPVFRVTHKSRLLLFRLAEAAIAQPEGTIRDVLFPVVSERVLRALVEESTGSAPPGELFAAGADLPLNPPFVPAC